MYLSSAAGINSCCPLAICYNPPYPSCFSRSNPLGLIVALSDDGTAQGSFFWDDGEGIGLYEVTLIHHLSLKYINTGINHSVLLHVFRLRAM